MTVRRAIIVCLACASASITGCGADESGPRKYPVRGTVEVNGAPASKVVVTFNNANPAAPGNSAHPVARADDQGRFELSTDADKDGAVEGSYSVTFFWPSDEGTFPKDRLDGMFSKPEASKIKVDVKSEENALEPFRLTIPAKRLKPASTDGPR
ncbi:MAG: hypothetical protein P4L85_09370 [Paludisphaera borealis]|uniref:hypothetical protein n=1 Tax=Paludisphaera borealis TaxID=1387353 RepID=UPI00283F168B|nr:hypothetical protein [Paludisphaera borealis]MDR3619547.1 hypothetical protein [Paludisphaera borealis]